MLADRPTLHIPGDVIKAVLDDLADDHLSLRSCTLVSCSWHSAARCQLFRTVVCRPDNPHLSPSNLSAFLSSNPDLVSHVHSLKVVGDHPSWTKELSWGSVAALLSLLPNLKSLSFERVLPIVTAEDEESLLYEAPHLVPGLTTITLSAIRCTDTMEAFWRILRTARGREPRPLRVHLKYAHSDDRQSFFKFLDVFGPDVECMSCNLIGSVGRVSMLASSTIADGERSLLVCSFEPPELMFRLSRCRVRTCRVRHGRPQLHGGSRSRLHHLRVRDPRPRLSVSRADGATKHFRRNPRAGTDRHAYP